MPLFLGFAIIPLAFMILTIPTWLQGVHAANDAAAEGARAFLLSGGDPDSINRTVRATEVSNGLPVGSLTVSSAAPVAGVGNDVRITVDVTLRAVFFFDLGSFVYTGSHVERYPTYVRTPR
ncbi:MAG: hypothetical protein HKN03_16460 [Acidimicrobiales bacterium]|nr:hypothetical protein [Acidimicrobiales bacterium]